MKDKMKYIFLGGLGFLVVMIGIVTILLMGSKNSTYSSSGSSATAISTNYQAQDTSGDDLEEMTITKSGVYHLSGSYSCISINTTGDVQLNLDGASISCNNGPAIYVEDADTVYITLTGENTVSATTTEDFDGAIYSTDDLVFSGDGSLKVTSNMDGIVSKDTLIIQSGTYNIEVDDDAIRGKDSVAIVDGTFNITAKGDAIKSTNEEESGMGTIAIDGGSFTINAGDDGIHAVGSLDINNGTFTIKAAEGLEATIVRISGGEIDITASDDGINATQKSSFYGTPLVEINGGNITISMGQGDTDGVDSNGDIVINGGTIRVTGQSTFDYDGTGTINGGEVICNGSKVTTLPTQMMGGSPMGGGRR